MFKPRSLVNDWKLDHFKLAQGRSIPIKSNSGDIVLVPVGRWILNDLELISEMTDWRHAARDSFFARFPASTASFTHYLKELYLLNKNSILFMIYSEQAGFKGHIGLTQVTEGAAEIDAVMLKHTAQGQGIGSSSLAALILWGQETFGIDTLTLEVLSSNGPAIALYSKFGFEITDTSTLKEITDGNSQILVDCKPGEKTTELCRIRMLRKANKF